MEQRKSKKGLICLILGIVLLSCWLHTQAPVHGIMQAKYSYLNHFISFPIGVSLLLYSMWIQLREWVNFPEISAGVRVVLGCLALLSVIGYVLIVLRALVGFPFDIGMNLAMWYEQYYCHMYGILVMLVTTLLINLSIER